MPPSGELADSPAEKFTAPPDPGHAGTLDDLAEQLRSLKVWAGDPSYERITERINADRSAAGQPSAKPAGYGLSLPGVYAVWLMVVVALYPLCAWFAQLKRRRSEWSWSYL